MAIKEIDYQREAEALLSKPEGSLPERQMLDRLHRYGVWTRGNTNPRGSLTVPAKALLNPNLMSRVSFYIGEGMAEEVCRKALLVIGQWGGEGCLADPIRMLQSEKTDSETRFYCLSAIRTIGGPRAVAAIAQVLRSGEPEMQEAALNAILDLATGGSASDIDSAADAGPVEVGHALEPEIAVELSAALSEISERKSLAFNLRYRAVDTLEYLEEIGSLVSAAPAHEPKSREAGDPKGEKPPDWSESFLGVAAGEPEVAPDLRPGTTAAQVEFDPPIKAQGRTGEMYIALLPIEDEYKDYVTKISVYPIYRTKQGTIMVVLQAFRHRLPEGVSRVRVKVRGAGGMPVDPVDDHPLEVGGVSLSFQFRVSDPNGLADPPRFILTKVE